MINRIIVVATTIALAFGAGGCVERLIKVTSNPPGATVWLNDQEIGSTPVTVPFVWYGQYSVTLRKEGCESIITSQETPIPLYQWPILDFAAECLLPINFVDEHSWHFDLNPMPEVDQNRLIIRAERMRIQSEAGLPETEPQTEQ